MLQSASSTFSSLVKIYDLRFTSSLIDRPDMRPPPTSERSPLPPRYRTLREPRATSTSTTATPLKSACCRCSTLVDGACWGGQQISLETPLQQLAGVAVSVSCESFTEPGERPPAQPCLCGGDTLLSAPSYWCIRMLRRCPLLRASFFSMCAVRVTTLMCGGFVR